jgi:hypothetical protein
MPTATLTTATVEVIGKPKPSKFADKPPYRPVLFNLADGSQVWKSYSEGSPELEWLNTGETYQAAIAGEEVTLIAPASAPVTNIGISHNSVGNSVTSIGTSLSIQKNIIHAFNKVFD